jgi:quinol monooxygenase YgiN
MKRAMMKYRIHEDKYDYFLSKLERFTTRIQNHEPDILEYSVFQAPDKFSFVHYISYADAETEVNHLAARYVKQFNKIILTVAKSEPVYIELNAQGQAQGLTPDLVAEEAQQLADTSLYRSESEVSIIHNFSSNK